MVAAYSKSMDLTTISYCLVKGKFMPKYIPGNPQIIVSNQPGAGGQVANKVFYETTKPDGLTLLRSDAETLRLQQPKGNYNLLAKGGDIWQ